MLSILTILIGLVLAGMIALTLICVGVLSIPIIWILLKVGIFVLAIYGLVKWMQSKK